MSSKKLIRKKQAALQQAEMNRKRLLEIIIAEEQLIEGSLSDILVKCGRAGCHCEKKPAHPITRLNIREGGNIKNKLVRIDDLDRVRHLVQTYKNFKQALRELAAIENQEKEIFERIKKARNRRYE